MDDTIVNESADLIPGGERAMTAVEEPVAPVGDVGDAVSDNGQPARVDAASSSNGADVAATSQGASLMEQFLSDPSHDYKTLKYGDVMDGVIAHIDREELLVDIGSKSEGIVPAREYSSLSSDEKKALNVGDSVLVFVVQPENPEGHAVVSIDRARQEKSWRRLQEIYEANDVIEAEVTNYNKGGLLVNLDGVRGFVPASQVSEIRGGDESSKQADMARLIGTSLPLKVIEINRHRNRLILSERQAIQERRDVMKERLIEELKEGEVRKGRVSSICDFGAFVDIGGADGLVHLSELSWSRVRHPAEVLKIGQEVDVYVLGINSQEKKIALSIKRTQAEPWSRVASKYEVGQLVRGAITQLANFGAFARIEDGIEGLIHVSELADERITHPKQVVREGQELLLRIIRIDPQRRRMGLSLRRALDTADDELVNVFGPEVLEERDRIVATIREALEAEGIEARPNRAARDQAAAESTTETDDTAAAGADQAPAAEPSTTTDDAPSMAAVAPQSRSAAFEQASAAATESRSKPRPAPAARPATPTPLDIPDEIGGEPLSAIAIAFARAGASDLVVEATAEDAAPDAATTDRETPGGALIDEPLPTADNTAPAATTAAMEAGSTAPSAEFAPPAEASVEATAAMAPADETGTDQSSTEESGSLVGSIAGALTNTVASVAGAVVDRMATGLAEAIRPAGGATTGETADSEPGPETDEGVSSDDGGDRPQ